MYACLPPSVNKYTPNTYQYIRNEAKQLNIKRFQQVSDFQSWSLLFCIGFSSNLTFAWNKCETEKTNANELMKILHFLFVFVKKKKRTENNKMEVAENVAFLLMNANSFAKLLLLIFIDYGKDQAYVNKLRPVLFIFLEFCVWNGIVGSVFDILLCSANSIDFAHLSSYRFIYRIGLTINGNSR